MPDAVKLEKCPTPWWKWALNMLELSNESARGFKFGWTKFFAIKAFLATPTPPSASTEGEPKP